MFKIQVDNDSSLLLLRMPGQLDRYSDRLQAGWLGFGSWQGQDFSLLHSINTGSRAHPASYPVGTVGSFLSGKVAGV
jgi:hypothetical protein